MATKKEKPLVPAVTCFEIAKELADVTEKIVKQEGELKEGDLESLQQWQAALEVKADNIAFVKDSLEHQAAHFKAIEEKARSLRKAREGAVERIRKYLTECMVLAGVKSIKTPSGMYSILITDGRACVRIDDESKIPFEYGQIVEAFKVNSDAIKKALEEGKEVPGAHMEQGAPFVTIR